MYKAVIIKLKNVRPHPNADRLKLATCEGNQVVVGLDAKEGDLGIYFPTDGQLSEEFCKANDLIRRKDENGNPAGGMFDQNRRIRTQKLRGEKSDGFWCPVFYLKYLGADLDGDHVHLKHLVLREGDEIESLNGDQICNKYVSPRTRQTLANISGKKAKKGSLMFKEHFDSAHFGRNSHKISKGDHVILTEKCHGTSQRVGYVLVEKSSNLLQRIILSLFTFKWQDGKYKDWEYLIGTRRVVLDNSYNKGSGFHSDSLRQLAAKPFINNLRKGETVFYEVVGFEPEGKLIMPSVDVRKIQDKEFTNKWAGQIPGSFDMAYTYGCELGEFKIFVYRITLTNEDGHSVDYSWKDVKKRCAELGVEHCPEIYHFIIEDDRDVEGKLTEQVEHFAEGESLLDSSHIREGVCVRVEGGIEPLILKHKSFNFKVLEGIIKDTGVLDLEEAS